MSIPDFDCADCHGFSAPPGPAYPVTFPAHLPRDEYHGLPRAAFSAMDLHAHVLTVEEMDAIFAIASRAVVSGWKGVQ